MRRTRKDNCHANAFKATGFLISNAYGGNKDRIYAAEKIQNPEIS